MRERLGGVHFGGTQMDSVHQCPRCNRMKKLYCTDCGHEVREMDRAAATDDRATLENEREPFKTRREFAKALRMVAEIIESFDQ